MTLIINNHKTIDNFVGEIKSLLQQARNNTVHQVNSIMVKTYFEIGRWIVEQEQKVSFRVEYGENVLGELSDKLINEFGRGFSVTNLKQMRGLYLTDWLLRITDVDERKFYELECVNNSWSLRKL